MDPETRQEAKTFGAIVIDAMRSKNFTIEKLSQVTGVSDRFLTYLVNGECEKLPAVPYVYGYVMKIAEALGIDGASLWQDYLKGSASLRRSGKGDALPTNRFVTPELNPRVIGAVAIAILIIGSLVFRLPALLGVPTVTLNGFPDALVVEEPTYRILGTIDPADELTINREPVYADTNGVFERIVTLEPGFNTFEFRAKRFLGKERILVKQIFYRAATQTSTSTFPYAPEENF